VSWWRFGSPASIAARAVAPIAAAGRSRLYSGSRSPRCAAGHEMPSAAAACRGRSPGTGDRQPILQSRTRRPGGTPIDLPERPRRQARRNRHQCCQPDPALPARPGHYRRSPLPRITRAAHAEGPKDAPVNHVTHYAVRHSAGSRANDDLPQGFLLTSWTPMR
jgi:hypothetical protein